MMTIVELTVGTPNSIVCGTRFMKTVLSPKFFYS